MVLEVELVLSLRVLLQLPVAHWGQARQVPGEMVAKLLEEARWQVEAR